ncbi:hypothetical protein PoB_005617900 [Plakobranchus ocellatus]|uniref:Uncharacterized protein n=1 Tax=Plakobranchus ocellatus TaxID=259542 RepID=A0AAV4CAS5_9GAST|nr:hypothetical protein PoB_005617900 [Plakobranchus ocellatus]
MEQVFTEADLKYGININGEYLRDSRFAHDVALCTEKEEEMEEDLERRNSENKNGSEQDTLLEKKIIDGLKDAQNGNQGQEEETGADQRQDGWMTSGKHRYTMAEEGTRSEEMEDICKGLYPAVDGQSL